MNIATSYRVSKTEQSVKITPSYQFLLIINVIYLIHLHAVTSISINYQYTLAMVSRSFFYFQEFPVSL